MPPFIWIATQLTLPAYDRHDLDFTLRTWLQERDVHVRRDPKIGLKVGFYYGYVITPPNINTWRQRFISLIVRYRTPRLYVYTTNHLPVHVGRVVNDCITPYVIDRGGAPLLVPPYIFEGILAPFKQVEEAT